MRKSIVIHICVAIIRNRKNMTKISVVIVCPGSMATGKYLEAQIKNYFDFHIIGVLAAHEVIQKLEKSEEQVDFIISTVSIRTEKYKVIKVHPFLQMEDMNLIQKETFQNQRMKPTTFQQKQELLIQNIFIFLKRFTYKIHCFFPWNFFLEDLDHFWLKDYMPICF